MTDTTERAVRVDMTLARIWQEGWVAGFFNRHRSQPDENGDYGISAPIVNPYKASVECICPLRGCHAHQDDRDPAAGDAMLRLRRAVEAYEATPAGLPDKPQAAYAVVDAARAALTPDGQDGSRG